MIQLMIVEKTFGSLLIIDTEAYIDVIVETDQTGLISADLVVSDRRHGFNQQALTSLREFGTSIDGCDMIFQREQIQLRLIIVVG